MLGEPGGVTAELAPGVDTEWRFRTIALVA